MDDSPRGHSIEPVAGNADAIITRGSQIDTLGAKMIKSAGVLEDVANGAHGQRGLAVEKLKEVIGESHKELKLAGERYKPTGEVLMVYGRALAEVQPQIATAVRNCTLEWEHYLAKSSAASNMTFSPQRFLPKDDPKAVEYKEQLESAADDAASAKAAWVEEARVFDSHYETWETAFETAAAGIGEANDGKIKDGFWDNVDGLVAGALTVLKWVGLALTIAAIIIGGPVIAALAALAAIATLVLTIYQATRGDATGKDIALAAIGVIPFGSFGKLGMLGKAGPSRFADNILGGLLTNTGRAGIRTELSVIAGSARSSFRFTGSGMGSLRNGFSQFARNHGSDGRGVDSIVRFFTGKTGAAINGSKPLDIIVSHWWTMGSRLNTGLSWGTGEGLYSRLLPGGNK